VRSGIEVLTLWMDRLTYIFMEGLIQGENSKVT
jgi:hypothetical protein